MELPKPKELVDAAGISPSYASMILSGDRVPPRSLAIHLWRKLDYLHPSIAEMTDAEMLVFERVEPWTPPQERAA